MSPVVMSGAGQKDKGVQRVLHPLYFVLSARKADDNPLG